MNPHEKDQDASQNAEREDSFQERIQGADREEDADRLRMLDELYERLESELEGDLNQEGPPRH
jgi:hypothetical protein